MTFSVERVERFNAGELVALRIALVPDNTKIARVYSGNIAVSVKLNLRRGLVYQCFVNCIGPLTCLILYRSRYIPRRLPFLCTVNRISTERMSAPLYAIAVLDWKMCLKSSNKFNTMLWTYITKARVSVLSWSLSSVFL